MPLSTVDNVIVRLYYFTIVENFNLRYIRRDNARGDSSLSRDPPSGTSFPSPQAPPEIILFGRFLL